MAEIKTQPVHFECCSPILRVKKMELSVRFYTELLGFRNAAWGNEEFTSLNRDSAGIYLCQGGQGKGEAWVWIGVENARQLYGEFAAKGVKIRNGPINHPWAIEFQVEDPDGNVLRFGSEPE